MRLAKFLANAGVSSRRKAEKLIAAGRITVNGINISQMGYKIDPEKDIIKLDGLIVDRRENIYLLLNKPPGYICSVTDPYGRLTVMNLVKDIKTRLYPVGRLDFDTRGLLLMTNDGEFTHLMIHPRYEIGKKYAALVKGKVSLKSLEKLKKGVLLDDGPTHPAKVRILPQKNAEKNTLLEIEIHEGRKRQVKRMCLFIGHEVLDLKRTAFSFLTLKGVAEGEYRYLTDQEVVRLKKQAKKEPQ